MSSGIRIRDENTNEVILHENGFITRYAGTITIPAGSTFPSYWSITSDVFTKGKMFFIFDPTTVTHGINWNTYGNVVGANIYVDSYQISGNTVTFYVKKLSGSDTIAVNCYIYVGVY